MEKPTVFFSHSSRDATALSRLKDLFLEKTGGAIEVFLSSDGQSIPLGRNWVHKVEQALNSASLMIVFVTPNSVGSHWLYFESGYAYSKGLRVVPVGFRGVDLTRLPPPLGLLQGFNITSSDTLDNLVVLANEVFGHSHANRFTEGEYQEVSALGAEMATATLGKIGSDVEQIHLRLDMRSDLDQLPAELLVKIAEVLSRRDVLLQRGESVIQFQGVSIIANSGLPESLEFMIDPELFSVNAAILVEIVKSVRRQGLPGIRLIFELASGIEVLTKQHKISSRLFGTAAHLHQATGFAFYELRFGTDYFYPARSRGNAYISITIDADEIPLKRVRELLDLLMEKRIVYFGPTHINFER